MRPSDALLEFLRWWEGLPGGKPALVAYDDGTGVWTIGYGTTRDVAPGDTCTTAQADAMLVADVDEAWYGVDDAIRVTLAQHEMDAVTSLAYNVGVDAVRKSTLLRRMNGGDFGAASDEFSRWVRAGGRILTGLVKRREAERLMFERADYTGRP